MKSAVNESKRVETNAEGAVVVISGASAGVGRATAREYAKQGARIGLLARGRKGLEAAVEDINARGGQAYAAPTDVSDLRQVELAARQIEDAFGPIDIWINNAMVTVLAPFWEIEPDEYRRVTDVTYHGVVHGTKVALRRMRGRDRGSIVQVGSALAYRGIPLQSAYCGAKHAIEGFTESLRSELIHEGSNIKLSMVQLPAVNTPQFSWCLTRMPRKPQPVPPIYQPEVAAKAIVYAAQHGPREVVVGGRNTLILWANKFFPGLGDRYLAKTAYEGQQYNGAPDPNRKANLWEPVEGDRGARGEFSHRARNFSTQLWLRIHPGITILLVASIGVLIVAAILAAT